ncbi:MAG: hypothetical protein RXR59_04645 [Sulfolobus sp.]
MLEEKLAIELYNAYVNRKEIEPFQIDFYSAKKVFQIFSSMITQSEGFGGYKTSFTTQEALKKYQITEPLIGILSKRMIIKEGNEVDLWFKNSMAEVELIYELENCTLSEFPSCVKNTYLGVEVPGTRFSTWNLTAAQILADDCAASRLYVGVPVEMGFNRTVELYLNGNKVREGRPSYVFGSSDNVVKWLLRRVVSITGFVSSGVFVGPINIKSGDKIRLKSEDIEYEVRFN